EPAASGHEPGARIIDCDEEIENAGTVIVSAAVAGEDANVVNTGRRERVSGRDVLGDFIKSAIRCTHRVWTHAINGVGSRLNRRATGGRIAHGGADHYRGSLGRRVRISHGIRNDWALIVVPCGRIDYGLDAGGGISACVRCRPSACDHRYRRTLSDD